MSKDKLRLQIAFEAARIMYFREESEYLRAKLKAGRRLCRGSLKPNDLPSNREIREQVLSFARLFEGDERTSRLREMRFAALRMMKRLQAFRPRLIGSVLTGHVRDGSDIDLHLFSDSLHAVTHTLDEAGLVYDTERKQVRKQGESQIFRHIHVREQFPFELTLYDENQAHYVFKSSITGKAIERKSIAELEQFLEGEYPGYEDSDIYTEEGSVDRFAVYQSLLAPLEEVRQSPKYHPEGDALTHSLQVFDLAREMHPYDEEFLLAALLHDVGKAIDPLDHVHVGLEALEGYITDRTTWLIAHHMEVHALHDGTLGQRAHRRLSSSENFEDLLQLGECDRKGRRRGVPVPEIEEALEYIQELEDLCQW
ncbi:tRNA adenylyltransferase [Planctomycetales bacterium 10988]|nr:tRNA adenylyltransferase [Planctomycetales bacterium 10988]